MGREREREGGGWGRNIKTSYFSTNLAFVYLCLTLFTFVKMTHLCTNFVLVTYWSSRILSVIDSVLSNFVCQNVQTTVEGVVGPMSEHPKFLRPYQPGGRVSKFWEMFFWTISLNKSFDSSKGFLLTHFLPISFTNYFCAKYFSKPTFLVWPKLFWHV